MSHNTTPMRFSGVPDYEADAGFDPHFTAEISNKMQVPKKICIHGSGDGGSDNDELNSNWSRTNGYYIPEKFDMQVPDRIMVRGQDQHIGTKALPRELQLEGTGTVQPDPEMIRILTPPRTITLLDKPTHEFNNLNGNNENEDETLVVYSSRARLMPSNNIPNGNINEDSTIALTNRNTESSGFYELDVQHELEHFRQQLKRMSERVNECEMELKERKDREQYIMYAGGIYLALQIFKWLFKSNQH